MKLSEITMYKNVKLILVTMSVTCCILRNVVIVIKKSDVHIKINFPK